VWAPPTALKPDDRYCIDIEVAAPLDLASNRRSRRGAGQILILAM